MPDHTLPLFQRLAALRRTPAPRGLGLLTLAGLLALGAAQASDDKKAAPVARPALTVTVARPELRTLPLELAANGNVAAWQEASVGTESNGLRLTEVRANVGDVVRAGELLARFADESVRADLAQARAALLEAEAAAADAAGNAERARGLQDSGALSTQQINQLLTAAQTTRARVEAARATLAAQELRLQRTQVLAPDSGVISARSATVGAVVGSGSELFRLIRQGRLEWRAEVTSAELGRLAPGTRALVTAPGGAQLPGRVRMVAPTVDPQTRTALVYVDLPATPVAAARAFKAGMFAKGVFQLGESTGVVTVPQPAVVVRDGFSHVYRFVAQADGNGRVAQTRVTTGRRLGDRVELVSGLAPEATVVVQGAGFLNDGDLVRAAQPQPAGAPALAASTAAAPVPASAQKPAPTLATPGPAASK